MSTRCGPVAGPPGRRASGPHLSMPTGETPMSSSYYDTLPDAELVTIPGAAHGFGDANWEEAMRRTIDFLAWNGVLEED